MSVAQPVKTKRIPEIDAARGLAMIFVCFSHFFWSYFWLPGRDAVAPGLHVVTLIASPSFMLISGMMLGLLHQSGSKRFQDVLVDRGLFLLTVAHVINIVSHVQRAGGVGPSMRWIFITDAIGVAIVVGPWLIQRLSARARVGVALSAYASSWLLSLLWHPESFALRVVRDTLFGTTESSVWDYSFPIIPWLAFYLGATVVGQTLFVASQSGERGRLMRALGLAGGVGIGAAVLGRLVARGATLLMGEPLWWLEYSTSPWQKLPPSPGYFLFFGGAGLLMTWAVFALYPRDRFGAARILTLFGRNSLFVYELQFFVYYVALYYFVLPYTPWWPVIFAGTVALIAGCTAIWHRFGGNRFITVGWRRQARAEARRASESPQPQASAAGASPSLAPVPSARIE